MKVLYGLFEKQEQAAMAAVDLKKANFKKNEIDIINKEKVISKKLSNSESKNIRSSIKNGAIFGAIGGATAAMLGYLFIVFATDISLFNFSNGFEILVSLFLFLGILMLGVVIGAAFGLSFSALIGLVVMFIMKRKYTSLLKKGGISITATTDSSKKIDTAKKILQINQAKHIYELPVKQN